MLKVDKYYKNFILCGEVDFHCLLCSETFNDVIPLDRHIMWEKHRKIIRDLTFVPKLRKDSIYKIKEIFYCPHCNHVMSSLADATQHVLDPKHIEKKANPIVEVPKSRYEKITTETSCTVVVGTLKLTLKEWNGIVNNKCVFCNNCEVSNSDFEEHIAMTSHMINLINSEVCSPDGVQFYRKINEDICYCFMCKSIFATPTAAEHCDDENHIEKMRIIREIEIRNRKKRAEVNVNLVNSQREFFDIDPENKIAECKICTAYINLSFDQMIEHKKTHNIKSGERFEKIKVDMEEVIKLLKIQKAAKKEEKPLYIFDHGKRRSELAKYGREHFIKLVPPGAKGFCHLCNRFMSAHITNFTNHVNGKIHQGFLELKGFNTTPKVHIKPKYTTKPLKEYMHSVIHAQEFNILWVNKELFFDIYSFMLIAIIDKKASKGKVKKVKCFPCNIIFEQDKVSEHIQTEQHKESHLNALVLTTIGEGFVREIQTNLYHCGVCNLVFPFWPTLNKHINGWSHGYNKNAKMEINRLAQQWYGRFLPHSLAPEEVYPYLMGLDMF